MSNVHGTTVQNAHVSCEPRMNETISNITNGNICGLNEVCIRLATIKDKIRPTNKNCDTLRNDFENLSLIEKVDLQSMVIGNIHNLISDIIEIL